MAGPYFVDDSGDGDGGLSWAKAETSINDLDTAIAFASGEIVYFGSDHVCQASNSAHLTITGPASGLPVQFVSSAVGSGTSVSYVASTSNQIDTTEGAYDLIFDGSFELYGLQCAAGRHAQLYSDQDELFYTTGVRFKLGANGYISFGGVGATRQQHNNITIDLTADGTTTKTGSVIVANSTITRITGISFVNAGYRTGVVCGISSSYGSIYIEGGDFSGFTNATTCELLGINDAASYCEITNCLTADTWAPFDSGSPRNGFLAVLTNVGPADAPTYLLVKQPSGTIASSASIYRTGGATVEGDACSWLITTTATCAEGAPFYTPWIYGTVSSTGSKTFDLYITNDTADFDNSQVWLEVEYLSTADEAIWALATDQRATITTTAAAQTDDTTSTWNGTGPSFTYKQKLSVTATVGETGQYRARVAVGVASIASSRYFYCDPKIGIS